MRIHKLPKSSIIGLRAGQIIVNVASCVKELVDNALDAGATEIKIQLVDEGLRLIEVVDNGRGMRPEDLRISCLPNSTSKIKSFEDIISSRLTFGFRGEALNALAHLSQLTLISKTAEMDLAERLSFDCNGIPKENPSHQYRSVGDDTYDVQLVIRCLWSSDLKYVHLYQVGTTVLVENLFLCLPVRRLELQRSSKVQVSSVLHFLTAYSLMHRHVEIILVTQSKRSPIPKTLLHTGHTAAASLRVSFTWFFGHSLANSMMDIDIVDANIPSGWRVTGLLSLPSLTSTGTKRVAFLFVNGYLVVSGLSKLIHSLTAFYHEFLGKKPFLQYVLNIEVHEDTADFNVTPAKQSVFVDKLPMIIQGVLDFLKNKFVTSSPFMPMNNLKGCVTRQSVINSEEPSHSLETHYKCDSSENRVESILQDVENLRESSSSALYSVVEKNITPVTQETEIIKSPVARKRDRQFGSSRESSPEASANNESDLQYSDTCREPILSNTQSRRVLGPNSSGRGCFSESSPPNEQVLCDVSPSLTKYRILGIYDSSSFNASNQESTVHQDSSQDKPFLNLNKEKNVAPEEVDQKRKSETLGLFAELAPSADPHEDSQQINRAVTSFWVEHNRYKPLKRSPWITVDLQSSLHKGDVINVEKCLRKSTPISVDERDLKNLSLESFHVCALNEATLSFPKRCFNDMEIIGQFNKGFIIGVLPIYDKDQRSSLEVFVIDQHATDEKYRYEVLCSKTSASTIQTLMLPIRLEVSPTEKQIILSNLALFRFNGFDIKESVEQNTFHIKCIEKEDDLRQLKKPKTSSLLQYSPELYLYAVPQYESQMLGQEDIMELIECIKSQALDLTETPKTNFGALRPQKLKAFFASKACRSAVMIGMELDRKHMISLVRQMAIMASPWNCPHGRPTIRHLFSVT